MFDNKIFDTVAGTLTANVAAAGSDTQIQFNDGGSFAGASGLLYDKTNIGLTLSRVADDALGPAFVFQQSRGAAGQDGDILGVIAFKGYNDAATPELTEYTYIKSSIEDSADGAENGRLDFGIMSWGTEENILSIVKSVDTSSTCVTVGRVDSPSAQLHVDATYSEHDFAAKIINLTVNRTGLLVMGSDNDGRGINASGKTGITAVSNNHYGAGIVCGPDTNIDSVCLVVMRSSAVSLGYYDQPMVAFRCYDVALDNAVMLRMSYDYGGSGHTKTGNYIEMLHHTTLLYKHTGKNVITHYNTGITPSASVVDAIQMWCADYAANDARLSIMGEKNTNTLTLGAGNVLLRPDTMADDSVSGETFVGTAGEDLAWGDVVYMAADGKFYKADADSSSTAPAVAFCTATISADASGEFLKRGWIRDDSAYNFTKGPGASGLIYLSTDAGAVTQTAPSGAGDQVQVLGWAYTADIWYFEPQLVVVEV